MKPLRQIFCIVPDCHVTGGHYRTLWQNHFYDGLKAVAGRVVLPQAVDFNWARDWRDGDPLRQTARRDAVSGQLEEQIENARRTHGLDAVISYCFAHDLNPELARRVIRSGVPWVNFFCDSTHVFGLVAELARAVSLNWFPEHAAIPSYAALGVPHACLPYALNPDFLPACDVREPLRQAVFIGVPTTNRITQIGLLRLMGCRVEVRGHGWVGQNDDPFRSPVPRSRRLVAALFRRGLFEKGLRRLLWPLVKRQAGGPLPDAELTGYLRASQVVLGLNQGKDAQGNLASYLKFRDVEFPGYGCCYLTELNDDLAAAFEIGREVLAYRSMGEAAEWLRRCRKDSDLCHKVGLAGRRRVLAAHTWAARVAELAARL